ncbi:MAG: hypothetical protein GYA24_19135 [Candidatus Lokiarchaeota archaeon]|nr:hypothetical protein [Candidatus Lokiarchaeota archaeon]
MPFEWLMQLFWGFFIGGVVVTAIMMVLLGMSISGGSGSDTSDHDAAGHDTGDHDAGHDTGDHDAGHDTGDHDAGHDTGDHDAGHDTGDHDAGNDGGHEGSGDQGLDSHIAVNLNVEAGIDSPDAVLYTSDKGQKAPLLLLVAGYLMFSGALGLSFSALIDVNIFIVLGIAFVPPFLLDKLLGLVWRKITKSETYIIPVETPLIGRKAIVFMKVNIDGGVVRIDATGSPIGSQRIPVMPLYSDKTFDAGKEVYICDYAPVQGKKFYLVDDDPSEVRKVRHVNV